MTVPQSTRRRVLQALGASGSTAAVAGCEAPTHDGVEAATAEPQPPSQKDAKTLDVERIAADPTDIPGPIDRDEPTTVTADFTTKEQVAEIEPGVTYTTMTFDGQIPGPMLRVRLGDHVEFSITNNESNSMPHNIDLHAVRGPGGGSEATTVAPGESASFRFKATYPGLFVYHCAVPNLDYHISSGMFGAILVEPEEGLPEVDHEFYLGQHELYTKGETGEKGHHDFDMEAMAREEPTYVLINGEKYAIGPDGYNEMQMQTGETARVFNAVGGPNYDSSFHPIGCVWDEVWPQGAIASDPHRYVQTTPVKPGSCVIATLHQPVPGPIKLVDHALSRVARKGALAVIDVQGEENPEIFKPGTGGGGGGSGNNDSNARSFDGWFDNVDNYDGLADATGQDAVEVEVGAQANGGGFGFAPPAVKVDAGSTVTWTWTGEGGMHNVKTKDDTFESELTDEPGHTFEDSFEETGTTKYLCVPHETLGMKGAVVVE